MKIDRNFKTFNKKLFNFNCDFFVGNNWGKCPDGNEGLGCGPQETFRGCADIAIHKDGDFIDVKPNEIDVESKHHNIPGHKNKNNEPNNNNIANVKFATYSYEVSKQTRQNATKTDLVENHNHDNHVEIRPQNNNFSFRTPEKTSTSTKKGPNSSERRPHSSNNRRKHKYENRSFYHFKTRNPSSSRNPFDQNWDFMMNNNRFPLSFGEIKIKRGKDQFRKKHDTPKSRSRNSKQMKLLPLMVFSDSEEDTSVSKGFSLDGRRYKDFWLL